MKYLIILGDGMADESIADFNGKTPLQIAKKPNIDWLAKNGQTGQLITVPDLLHPGSEVANMAVLGYDVEKLYNGRGVLEAASMGINLSQDDLAFRCNLITIEHGDIKNHSAGHISNEEGRVLIDFLNEKMGNEKIRFYPGVSYRHLLVIKGGNKMLRCTPPHDIIDSCFEDYLIQPIEELAKETAVLLNNLILESQEILKTHPVNKKRKNRGKPPANSIWPWSPGFRPDMPTLKQLFGVERSAVISAVDLIQGIGIYAGMEVIKVKGATGLYTTNYEGKAMAALEALKQNDLVYLHIEASDEAGHEGNVTLKIKTIEYLDERVIKLILKNIKMMDEEVAIAVLPDHPTPCELKTHTRKPVPFLIYRPGIEPDNVECYDENTVKNGKFGLLKGDQFIKAFLDV